MALKVKLKQVRENWHAPGVDGSKMVTLARPIFIRPGYRMKRIICAFDKGRLFTIGIAPDLISLGQHAARVTESCLK